MPNVTPKIFDICTSVPGLIKLLQLQLHPLDINLVEKGVAVTLEYLKNASIDIRPPMLYLAVFSLTVKLLGINDQMDHNMNSNHCQFMIEDLRSLLDTHHQDLFDATEMDIFLFFVHRNHWPCGLEFIETYYNDMGFD